MEAATDTARRILREFTTFAVVGASPDPSRPSHGVMQTLMSRGYDVVPIRPGEEHILGRQCYPTLEAVPEPVEVVDIFRRSDRAGAHVDEAIAVGAKAVWMQLGVIDTDAAARARDAGLLVVMDRCPAIELRKGLT
jgi:predicted CoA-binding protein